MKCKVPKENLRDDRRAFWAAESVNFHPDDPKETRGAFKHDEDEIIYSNAFRRLSHKSQIVVRPERHDHFRSRLTHTLEVNQIAESIGYQLGLNISLINSSALGHDIGHCPFGHAGEREFQQIMRMDVLPFCNETKLIGLLKDNYGAKIGGFQEHNIPENGHWLFHHAFNSIKIMDRKMKEITDMTKSGIRKHSWSPWQTDNKFGIPETYEAQAVAIADQVAGINHDTEDILSCPESEYDSPDKIRVPLPEYLRKLGLLPFSDTEEILNVWFLTQDSAKANGWSRKKRLQKVINSVVECSLKRLVGPPILRSTDASEDKKTLCIEEKIGKFLNGYEKFIRDEVIKGVSWFRHRDAIAGSVIKTAYNFFKHYAFRTNLVTRCSPGLKLDIENRIEEFKKSILTDNYDQDVNYKTFLLCANSGHEEEVKRALQTIDYVSSMTDNRIMEIHEIAHQLFR